MLKIVAVLAICCWLSVSQAYDCESSCPKNSKCVAQDKCECEYGYRTAIGEFDGLPYCQWQGTTTTQKTPNSNDNAGFPGDHSHEEDQKQDVEFITTKVNGKPKAKPVIMEESHTVVEGNDNEIFKIATETSTETAIETSTETAMETNAETNTETNTETPTEIPTTSEISDLTTTTQETNAVMPFNVDESDHHHHDDDVDDFEKFQLNNVSQNGKSANVNSLDTTTTTTTEDLEVTTIRGFITTLSPIIKITKHVERISYRSTATETFYTFLGILCPSLAFIFAAAVLFDCVKL